MLRDLRLACRTFTREPVFALTAVVILAIGIGGSTAVFSVVDAVLLQPLPYRDPDRLVAVGESRSGGAAVPGSVSATSFAAWKADAAGTAALSLFSSSSGNVLSTPRGAVQVTMVSATPEFFSVLGVEPASGRGPARTELSPAPRDARELFVSDAFWRNELDADPGIVGRTLRLENRQLFEVAGVLPRGFAFPAGTDVWTTGDLGAAALERPGTRGSSVVGRLREGATPTAARAAFTAISARLGRDYPESHAGWMPVVEPLHESIVGGYRLAVLTLYGAVAAVLLIGCANVSNLLLTRGLARGREMSIRAALGATRGRLVRQLFAESLVLAVAGCAAGSAIAVATLPFLMRLMGDSVPRLHGAVLDMRAFAYCTAASFGAALVAGLFPAIQSSRADLQPALAAEGERGTASPGHARLQLTFVAVEVAVSLTLMTGAVLLGQSFVRLRQVDLGFSPRQVISLDVRLPIFRFSQNFGDNDWYRLANRTRDVLSRVRSVPGVTAASVTTFGVPLAASALQPIGVAPSTAAARGPAPDATSRTAFAHLVSSGYFATLGMPLLRGRDFTESDASGESQLTTHRARAVPREGVAIVNERAAALLFPGEDALGRYISTELDRVTTPRRRVVGIVRNARSETLRTEPPAEVFVPYLEEPSFAMTLLVRTPRPAAEMIPALRQTLRVLDSELSSANARTLEEVVDRSMGSSTFTAATVGLFATLGFVLSGLGVYGIVAFSVVRRTREIGIRRALGASNAHLVRLLSGQTGVAVAAGAAAGIAAALVLSRYISSLLFGVPPTDPVSFGMAAAALAAVAALAAYLPIRRALTIAPADALRQ